MTRDYIASYLWNTIVVRSFISSLIALHYYKRGIVILTKHYKDYDTHWEGSEIP